MFRAVAPILLAFLLAPGIPALAQVTPIPGDPVALTPLATDLGVLVAICDHEVRLFHPDGSETRLRGRWPEEVVVKGDRRPLISNDEVYVTPSELDQLLPERTSARPPLGKGAAAFTTFETPKPVIAVVAPPPKAPAPKTIPPASPEEVESFQTLVTPVLTSLSMSETRRIDDPDFRGEWTDTVGLSPRTPTERERSFDPRGPLNRELSYFRFESEEGGRRQVIGDYCDPLFGFGSGFSMLTPERSGTRLGASVFLPAMVENGRAGEVAALAEHHAGKFRTELAVAGDGSYRTFLQWESRSGSVTSSFSNLEGDRWYQFGWQKTLGRGLNVYGWSVSQRGRADTGVEVTGVRWQKGSSSLTAETFRRTETDSTVTTPSLSYSFSRRALEGTLRYAFSGGGEPHSGLSFSCSPRDLGPVHLSVSSPAPERGQPRTYALGVGTPADRNLSVQAHLSVGGSRTAPEWNVLWQPAPDRTVMLRVGRLDLGDGEDSSFPRAVMLQMRFEFGETRSSRFPAGTVRGQVRDTSGRPLPEIAVSLDGTRRALTDADGRYAFEETPVGAHEVLLPAETLPVDFRTSVSRRSVYVASGAADTADFMLLRLCRITGRVAVDAAGAPARDGLAGVIVKLNTGQRTVTDEMGRYVFSALPPGRYAVSCETPSGFLPVPPAAWDFQLNSGDRATSADFIFVRQEREIKFGSL